MTGIFAFFQYAIPITIGLFFLGSVWIKVIREYERAVVFRLGRLLDRSKGPGIFILFYPIDNMVKISLRTVTMDVPPQDIITRDNVSVQVNAVIYFQVIDPAKAVVSVENYEFATSQIAQTTLRSVLGQVELDDLLSEREKLNLQLQEILDRQTDMWGVKVSHVEIKKVDLPQEMQRAMARQAEAERERRAKVINAEGEYQAAEKLVMAAKMMNSNPIALQMRYLQTLNEISSEGTHTVVFPFPMEMMKAFTVNPDATQKIVTKIAEVCSPAAATNDITPPEEEDNK
ncbi:slipin family protein [Candidatus Sumerlaeota bacterium]|nr:slipin family protein [Candidatus Sumerlaeales bacterium]NLD60912.1 slipin family protein [Candidatus Sumerlaeota bacterium]